MDKWLLDLVDKLNGARTPAEVMQVIDRLEDAYDAFSGPARNWSPNCWTGRGTSCAGSRADPARSSPHPSPCTPPTTPCAGSTLTGA